MVLLAVTVKYLSSPNVPRDSGAFAFLSIEHIDTDGKIIPIDDGSFIISLMPSYFYILDNN